jgi:hypothetical protein
MVARRKWEREGHVELTGLPVNPSCTFYGQVSRVEGMATHRKEEGEGTHGASRTSGQPILHSLWAGQ